MKQILSIICLVFFSPLSIAVDKNINSETNTAFSIVKEGGLYIWKSTSSAFSTRSFSIKIGDNKYWAKNLLILVETDHRTHIGIPMLKTEMKLTAWELTEKEIKQKLWVIKAKADTWNVNNKEIILTKMGCCDEPNKIYKYDVITGKLKQ